MTADEYEWRARHALALERLVGEGGELSREDAQELLDAHRILRVDLDWYALEEARRELGIGRVWRPPRPVEELFSTPRLWTAKLRDEILSRPLMARHQIQWERRT